jgi:hypothetical protein
VSSDLSTARKQLRRIRTQLEVRIFHIGHLQSKRRWIEVSNVLMQTFRVVSLSSLLAAMCCQLVAAPVVPGQVLVITNSWHPDGGGIVEADANLPFEIRNASDEVILTGFIQNRIVKSGNLGTAIISPHLRDLVSSNGTARIVRFVSEGFANVGIDVTVPPSDDVSPNQVTRSSGDGDTLDFQYDPNVITPPAEGTFIVILTDARGVDFNGVATIYAEESPGGAVYSTTVEGMARPVAIGPGVRITSFVPTGPHTWDLTFEAELDGEYRLLWSNDLTNWTVGLGFIYTLETPHTTSVSPFDPSAQYPPAQFYRLESQ